MSEMVNLARTFALNFEEKCLQSSFWPFSPSPVLSPPFIFLPSFHVCNILLAF